VKESTRVLTALGVALAGGAAIAASGSPALLRAADFVAPIGALWVNAIRMTVIPLVVSLLITGVASATDVRTIGRLGGRTLVVFLLLLAGTAAVVVPLGSWIFSLLPRDPSLRPPMPAGAAEAAGELVGAQSQTFAAWLTSFLPSNPIAAAANGAMVPLLIFTLLFGLAITRTAPELRATLVGFFQSLGDAMLVLVRWVVLAAPIGVFALVLPLAAHSGAALVGGIGAYILAYSAAALLFSLPMYPVVALFGGISMRRFARAALPAQLIAVSSSSSVATLPAMVESAEEGMGLPKRVTGFVLPLAVSAFKLAAPVSWTVGAVFVAWFYGIELGFREMATIGFAAVFLSFAAPGVPRGAFLMLAPLFTAIGLPVEGIGILIAIDAIPDAFSTILNVTGDLAATALVAERERRDAGVELPVGGAPEVAVEA
jgi:Na+/H+-dicarboxylate symporter